MEIGKTYCTRCGLEVKGFTCQNCDPTIPVKRLNIEELREQFEKDRVGNYFFGKNKDGKYKDYKLQYMWEGYQSCARANGILKE